MPLTLRLAFRDSARNRSRSGPAVAAIMAALAATVGLSVFLVSSDQRSEALYQPTLPANVMEAYASTPDSNEPPPALVASDWDTVRAAVATSLPGARPVTIATVGTCDAEMVCNSAYADVIVNGQDYGTELVVADADEVATLTGRPVDGAVRQALADGNAVVLGGTASRTINVTVQHPATTLPDSEITEEKVALPTLSVDTGVYSGIPLVVVSAETARRVSDGGVRTDRALWFADHDLGDKDMEAANKALRAAGVSLVTLHRDEGYKSEVALLLLALVGISTLVTLGATAIATGLAGAEARPDLATLAAVGASPRIRRSLSMAQAASVALTGAALGVFAGLVPAYAVLDARVDYPFVVPWGVVGLVVVAVPILSALLAGLFTRSRLPMKARIE